MSNTIELNKENFTETVRSNKPVLVDYWAEWCGPCKMVAPILEEVASDMSDKLTVGKVDVDENQELAAQLNIMSIPTLVLFKDGEVVDQAIGALSKAQLLSFLEQHI
jgi:thioredoxin 1